MLTGWRFCLFWFSHLHGIVHSMGWTREDDAVACLFGPGTVVDGEVCLIFLLLVLLPVFCFFSRCWLPGHVLDSPGWPRNPLPAPSLCLYYVRTRYVLVLLTMRRVQLATGSHSTRQPATHFVQPLSSPPGGSGSVQSRSELDEGRQPASQRGGLASWHTQACQARWVHNPTVAFHRAIRP